MRRKTRTTAGGLTVTTETEYHPVVTYATVTGHCWLHWRHADMAIGDVICSEVESYRRIIHDGVWWGYEIGVARVPIEQFYWRYTIVTNHEAAHREPRQPPTDPFLDLL